jgi:predicted DCC family thiol-disulfide oxidoreductase YuxK
MKWTLSIFWWFVHFRLAPSTSLITPQPKAPSNHASSLFQNDNRPVILFDGVCNMCNSGVNFALDWDQNACFRFAALQSEAGRSLLRRAGRNPDDISSIVLVDIDRAYIKSDAVLRISKKLAPPLPLAGFIGLGFPPLIRDAVYDLVAKNR